MEQEQPTTPRQPTAPITEEAHTALEILREHAPAVIGGVALAVVIFLGYTWTRHRAATHSEVAAQLYASAQSAAQLQAVIDEHPKAAVAALALLGLASERYHEGNYELAAAHYQQFISQHSQHPMRQAAELGLIYCDEALGRLEEAASGFSRFAADQQDHYLLASALLGQARVLTHLGRFDEAAEIYDAMISDPDQRWQGQARSEKSYMEQQRRALN